MRKMIDMAREAGMTGLEAGGLFDNFLVFEALVRADERERYEAIIASMTKLLEAQQKRESVAVDMIAAGIAAEREACAKVCENNSASYSERASRPEKVRDINPEVARVAVQTCGHVAAAIRARGKT